MTNLKFIGGPHDGERLDVPIELLEEITIFDDGSGVYELQTDDDGGKFYRWRLFTVKGVHYEVQSQFADKWETVFSADKPDAIAKTIRVGSGWRLVKITSVTEVIE